ncbi:peptide ABC transporter substrate-binding protein [Anaerolentibacter hominis]|uniref:ABC transporter substrate-binding protein n=1 Tax=Anaerolentibacter hominis TaxID=3079009 RepID=UPI0031B862AB
MKKHKLICLLLVFAMVVSMLTGCGKKDETPTDGKGDAQTSDDANKDSGKTSGGEKVVTMAMTSDWDTLMPMNTTSSHADIVNENMFDRLIVINRDGTFEPRLAESWDINDASDKITYHLNPNAKWHDGEPVTAADVVFTCQLASDPEANLARKTRMLNYAGTDETGTELSENSIAVKAIDEHTVEFTLKQPMDPLPIFALMDRDTFILPEHLLKDIPMSEIKTADFWQHPVGSGPMIFDSKVDGERIEFKVNKDYHLGAPNFDRFIIRKMPASNLMAGLMSGEIDLVAGGASGNIPLADWEAVQAMDNVSSESLSSFGYQYLVCNTTKDYLPKEIRQAINLAINRDVIINQLMKGEGVAACSPLPPDHLYYDENLKVEYDPEKAAQMVKDAGWDESRTLQFLVPIGNEVREKSAPLIQQDLAKIGIKTQIVTQDFPTHLDAARDGKFDLCLMGSAGSIDPDESTGNLKVGALNNFSQTTDKTYSEYSAKGREGLNFEERKPWYDKYNEYIYDQCGFIWLYFQNNLFAYSNRMSGIPSQTTDFEINKQPWKWQVND